MRCVSSRTVGRVRPHLALAAICLSIFISGIDTTIVNVALPTLARLLKASNAELQWIVDAFPLTAAGFLLSAGNLGDRYGRRGLLCFGLALFAATSAMAATIATPEALIAARAVMGLGAASIFPTTLALITNIFTDPIQRAKAIGLWTATGSIGVAVGPIAGGWLVQHFSVGSIFWVNVPIAALAIVGALLFVPTSRDPAPPALDFAGLVLSAIGVTVLTYTIIEAPNVGLGSERTWAGFVGAVMILAAFVWWESRTPHPMLEISIFANRRFSGGCLAMSAAYLALFGFVFVMTQYLQFVTAYSAFETGVRLLPVAVGVFAASILAPGVVERIGTVAVVFMGLLIFAIAMALSGTFRADTTYWVIGPAMALFGGGLGFTVAAATESVMGSLTPAAAGVGAAVASTLRQLTGSLGVAIVGSVFASIYMNRLDHDASLLGLDPATRGAMRQSMATAEHVIGQLSATQVGNVPQAVESAFLSGLWVSCQMCAAIAVAAAVIVVIVLPPRAASRADDTTTPASAA